MRRRITWLDAMKGFMIIFVVMCHSLVLDKNIGFQGNTDAIIMYVINIFIMPCFFAISGFLYKRVKTLRQYGILWYKKFFSLFVPYFIFSVLLHYYMHAPNSLMSGLYRPIFLLWFLFALFFIFIIVGTLDLLHVSMGAQLLIYLVAMVAQTRLNWWIGPDFDMNPITCTLGYITFFYVGYLIKHYWNYLKALLSRKMVTLGLFIVLTMGTWIQAKFTGVFPYNTDQVMLSDIITKLISVPTFFSLFISFNVHFRWLTVIGRGTLVIYLVHYFALHTAFLWIMMNTVIRSPMMQSGIRFASGMLGSLIVMWLVKKIGIIKIVFYPRKYLDKLILK